ncbi:hypothetical protein C8R43DRAFT_960163 [Mycena crocata]|nr:hypothetical protein C8R43DRAFT_960163 [Mycena crocata]
MASDIAMICEPPSIILPVVNDGQNRANSGGLHRDDQVIRNLARIEIRLVNVGDNKRVGWERSWLRRMGKSGGHRVVKRGITRVVRVLFGRRVVNYRGTRESVSSELFNRLSSGWFILHSRCNTAAGCGFANLRTNFRRKGQQLALRKRNLRGHRTVKYRVRNFLIVNRRVSSPEQDSDAHQHCGLVAGRMQRLGRLRMDALVEPQEEQGHDSGDAKCQVEPEALEQQVGKRREWAVQAVPQVRRQQRQRGPGHEYAAQIFRVPNYEGALLLKVGRWRRKSKREEQEERRGVG